MSDLPNKTKIMRAHLAQRRASKRDADLLTMAAGLVLALGGIGVGLYLWGVM